MSPLPGSPTGPPWRERYPSSEPSFTYPTGFPVKVPHPGSSHRAPTERDAPFLEPSFIHLYKSLVNEPLPCCPTGTLWREMSVSRAFLSINFRVPSKGAPPPGSPHRTPTDRDAPFPEPSIIRLSKSLVNEPTPGCPTGLLWREMPPSRSPWQSFHRDRCLVSRALLQLSPRFPVNGPTPGSQRGSYRERCPYPEPSSTYKSLLNEPPPSRFPSGAPMERDTRFQSLSLHIFLDPQ